MHGILIDRSRKGEPVRKSGSGVSDCELESIDSQNRTPGKYPINEAEIRADRALESRYGI